MKSIAPMLEQELEGAVDIKDKQFLRRYIMLMAENFVQKDEYVTDIGSIQRIPSDIQILAESMKQNFERMDRRFEDMLSLMNSRFEAADKHFEDMQKSADSRFADIQKSADMRFEDRQKYMDRRFDDVNKRFTMMFSFVTLGFVVLSTLVTVFQLLS